MGEFYPINPRNPCSRHNLEFAENDAPLRRNATIEPVGNAAAFLPSDLTAGVTAKIVHGDSGANAVVGGMAAIAG
ncbi:SDR family oxidoreductase [Paraburkholderia sediminicola]|uniref:SDR family oxidoreductase n=1 Tax=Paraburkholderia sediminicola TaxID=458836 RepID=UPI0038BD835B